TKATAARPTPSTPSWWSAIRVPSRPRTRSTSAPAPPAPPARPARRWRCTGRSSRSTRAPTRRCSRRNSCASVLERGSPRAHGPPMSKKSPAGKMPFLDHLEELRMRLFWSFGALAVATMAAFALVWNYPVVDIVATPIKPYLPDGKLIFTHPADPIAIVLKVAFGLGLAGAAPVIVYQLWAFLSPALHAHEKRVVLPVIGGAFALFLTGAFLAVRFAMPAMFDVLY